MTLNFNLLTPRSTVHALAPTQGRFVPICVEIGSFVFEVQRSRVVTDKRTDRRTDRRRDRSRTSCVRPVSRDWRADNYSMWYVRCRCCIRVFHHAQTQRTVVLVHLSLTFCLVSRHVGYQSVFEPTLNISHWMIWFISYNYYSTSVDTDVLRDEGDWSPVEPQKSFGVNSDVND